MFGERGAKLRLGVSEHARPVRVSDLPPSVSEHVRREQIRAVGQSKDGVEEIVRALGGAKHARSNGVQLRAEIRLHGGDVLVHGVVHADGGGHLRGRRRAFRGENLLGGVEEEDANLERRAEFEAHALAPAILAARAVAPSSAAA